MISRRILSEIFKKENGDIKIKMKYVVNLHIIYV